MTIFKQHFLLRHYLYQLISRIEVFIYFSKNLKKKPNAYYERTFQENNNL